MGHRSSGEQQFDGHFPFLFRVLSDGGQAYSRHLNGEISLEEAAAGAVMDTRRYAKRQLTWFRNQLPDWPWVAPEQALAVVEKTLSGN